MDICVLHFVYVSDSYVPSIYPVSDSSIAFAVTMYGIIHEFLNGRQNSSYNTSDKNFLYSFNQPLS